MTNRAERKKEQVCSTGQYQKVFRRISQLPNSVEHLVVQIGAFYALRRIQLTYCKKGIPIAYPRMVFLETALESKLNPLVALGKSGSWGLSGFVNKFNADAELLDDLVGFSLWHSRWSQYENAYIHRMITGLLDHTRFVYENTYHPSRLISLPCRRSVIGS